MNNEIEIKVKHLSHGIHSLKIKADAPIQLLKEELSKLSKLPAAEIKLIFKGKVLKKGDDKLTDLNIINDSCLHMIHDKPKTETQPNTNPFNTQQNTTPQQNSNPNSNQQTPPNPFSGMNFGNLGQGQEMPGMGQGMGMPGMGGGMNNPQLQAMMQNPQMRQMAQNLLSNPDMLRNMISNNPMLSQMAQNNPQLRTMLDNPDMMRNMGQTMFGNTPNTSNTTPLNTNNNTGTQNNTTPNSNPQSNTTPPQMPNFGNMFQNMQGMNPGMFGQMGQGMNQPGNGVAPEERFKDQLKKLEEMGFPNKEVNLQLLAQFNGNVDLVINSLLSS